MAVAEAYPQLKADKNFLDLQDQLAEIEDQIQMARRYYNGTVRNLNISIQSFPDVLLARALGFKEEPFFELDDRARRRPRRSRSRGASRERDLRALRSRLVCCSRRLRPAGAVERILRFVSDVKVERNGDLVVTETIARAGGGQGDPPRHPARFSDQLSRAGRRARRGRLRRRSRSPATARRKIGPPKG